MAAEGEEGTERRGEEWVARMDRAVLGEVIPVLPADRDVLAGRELRGGVGRRGGHLLLLLARRKTTERLGLGQ